MNVIDIVIGVFLVIGFVRGFQKGFVIELTSLLSVLLGIIGAFKVSGYVETYLYNWVSWDPKFVQLASFILSFLVIVIIVSIIGKLLTRLIQVIALGMLNRFIGAIFGFLKVALVLIFLILIFNVINKKELIMEHQKINESVIYSTIDDAVENYFPDIIAYAKENDYLPKDVEDAISK